MTTKHHGIHRPFYAYVERGTIRATALTVAAAALPYVWLMADGSRAFNGFGTGTLLKFIVSALYFPAGIICGAFLLPHRVRAFFLFASLTAYSFFLLFMSGYFSYFRVFPALSMIGRAEALPAIAGQLVRQVFGLREWVAIACWALSMLGVFLLTRRHVARRLAAAGLVAVIVMFTLHMNYRIYVNRSDPVSNMMKYDLTNAYLFYGFVPPSLRQIEAVCSRKVTEALKPLRRAGRSDPKIAAVKNIILVQVESLDGWVVDVTADGEPVMPFLQSLKSRGLYFDSFYAMHSGGGTTDAELSTYFSMLPLRGGSGFMSVDYAKPIHLVGVLRGQGIGTYVLHPNSARYFNRRFYESALKTAGAYFEDSFSDSLGGWEAKDSLFFAEALPKLSALPQPFLAHLITMQSHGPFVNHGACLYRGAGIESDYLCSMHEVDAALRELFDGLGKSGFLVNTAIFVYGDHESGVKKSERERVPLFVVYPGVKPTVSHALVSQIDIAPTVAAMLGIDPSSTWLGYDLRTADETRVIDFNDGRTLRRVKGVLTDERDPSAEGATDYSRYMLRGE